MAIGIYAVKGQPGPPVSLHDAELRACPTQAACNPIRHIVIIDKENRSFDSMFGTFPGVNGATTYKAPNGEIRPLGHQPDQLQTDLAHDPESLRVGFDHGKMDRFGLVPYAVQNGVDVADSQFHREDIPNYWRYASTFTLADNFFSDVLGPTFPNRLFAIAAQSARVFDNPPIPYWGCDAPRTYTVQQLTRTGRTHLVYPCFDFQTLADLLDARHISWKYYAPSWNQDGYIWSSFDAVRHIRFGLDWKTKVVNYEAFAGDASAGKLPTVTWLAPPGPDSDHPVDSMCVGENWTVDQINAIMSNAKEWAQTVVILTWDDGGGLFDHVSPPKGPDRRIMYGFRVPAIIISPYARRGYVDHTRYDFASVLKFVEDTLGLPSLTRFDAHANDLMNAFDFSQHPPAPIKLAPRNNCSGLPLLARVVKPQVEVGSLETLSARTAPGAYVLADLHFSSGKTMQVSGTADINGWITLRFRVPRDAAATRRTTASVVLTSPYRPRPGLLRFTVMTASSSR